MPLSRERRLLFPKTTGLGHEPPRHAVLTGTVVILLCRVLIHLWNPVEDVHSEQPNRIRTIAVSGDVLDVDRIITEEVVARGHAYRDWLAWTKEGHREGTSNKLSTWT